MTLKLGQKVLTPNGPGTYQFPLFTEGRILMMVSHKPTDPIDVEKCQCCSSQPGGAWKLAGYNPDEVKPI